MKLLLICSLIVLSAGLSASQSAFQDEAKVESYVASDVFDVFQAVMDRFREIMLSVGNLRDKAILEFKEFLESFDIMESIKNLPSFAERIIKRVIAKVQEFAKQAAKRVEEIKENVIDQVTDIVESFRNVSESLGDKFEEILEELGEGVSATTISATLEKLGKFLVSMEAKEVIGQLPDFAQSAVTKVLQLLGVESESEVAQDYISIEVVDLAELVFEIQEIMEQYERIGDLSGAARDFAILELNIRIKKCKIARYLQFLPRRLHHMMRSIITHVQRESYRAEQRLRLIQRELITNSEFIIEAIQNVSETIGDKIEDVIEQLKDGNVTLRFALRELREIVDCEEFEEVFDQLPRRVQYYLRQLYEVATEGFVRRAVALTGFVDQLSKIKQIIALQIQTIKQKLGTARDFALVKLNQVMSSEQMKAFLAHVPKVLKDFAQKAFAKVQTAAKAAGERLKIIIAKAKEQASSLAKAIDPKYQEIKKELQDGFNLLKQKAIQAQQAGRAKILELLQSSKVQAALKQMPQFIQEAATKLSKSLA